MSHALSTALIQRGRWPTNKNNDSFRQVNRRSSNMRTNNKLSLAFNINLTKCILTLSCNSGCIKVTKVYILQVSGECPTSEARMLPDKWATFNSSASEISAKNQNCDRLLVKKNKISPIRARMDEIK
jgi:hypothetical protein